MEKCGGTTLDLIYHDKIGERYVRASPRQSAFSPDAYKKQYPDNTVFHGHFSYGAHRHHAESYPIEYTTVLREPVDRFVSHYYHVTTRKDHPQYPTVQGMTIGQYMDTDMCLSVKNIMTRRLAGVCDNESDLTIAYSRALANLRTFPLVGVLQHLDEYLTAMAQRYDFEPTRLSRSNVGKRKTLAEIPTATLDRIREENDYDINLYEHVLQRLQENKTKVLRSTP